MKKKAINKIINKIAIKLLILIQISFIVSIISFVYLCTIYGKVVGIYENYPGAARIYVLIAAFISSLIIFIVILLIAINGRVRYLNYISETVTNIKTQQFLSPIAIKGRDEIAQLAKDINTMSARLKENYEKEKKMKNLKMS